VFFGMGPLGVSVVLFDDQQQGQAIGGERNQPAAHFQLDFLDRNSKNGSNNERPD